MGEGLVLAFGLSYTAENHPQWEYIVKYSPFWGCHRGGLLFEGVVVCCLEKAYFPETVQFVTMVEIGVLCN